MSIILEEITGDDDSAMECAGYVRIATFKNRVAFEASDFKADVTSQLRATEVDEQDGFDNLTIWSMILSTGNRQDGKAPREADAGRREMDGASTRHEKASNGRTENLS